MYVFPKKLVRVFLKAKTMPILLKNLRSRRLLLPQRRSWKLLPHELFLHAWRQDRRRRKSHRRSHQGKLEIIYLIKGYTKSSAVPHTAKDFSCIASAAAPSPLGSGYFFASALFLTASRVKIQKTTHPFWRRLCHGTLKTHTTISKTPADRHGPVQLYRRRLPVSHRQLQPGKSRGNKSGHENHHPAVCFHILYRTGHAPSRPVSQRLHRLCGSPESGNDSPWDFPRRRPFSKWRPSKWRWPWRTAPTRWTSSST